MSALFAPILLGMAQSIAITLKKIVVPLIPIGIYGMFVVMILTFCGVIAGVGGSLLFYVILFFYVRALINYNPAVAEAEAQAAEARQMNNGNMNQ